MGAIAQTTKAKVTENPTPNINTRRQLIPIGADYRISPATGS
jgi:hypothetical protein